MRRTCALSPVVVLLLVPMTAHPQDGVHFELLAGPLFEPTHVQHDLHVGWTAGLGLCLDLRSDIGVVYGVSFCRFPDGDWSEEADGYIYYPAGTTGADRRTSKPPFHNGYEAFASLRFGAPGARVGSYLSLTAGVQSARLRWDELRLLPGEATRHHWEWVTKGFTAVGVGVTIPVRRHWRLMLESRSTMATDGTAVFVPVVTGVQLFL